MLKKILILSSLVLTGCTSTPNTVYRDKPPLILPWPTPMMICEISGVKITPEGRVELPYEDNVNIAVCERDMLRYILDLKEMICKHQPKDKECND